MEKHTGNNFLEPTYTSDIELFLNEVAQYVTEDHLDIGCGQGLTTLSFLKKTPYANITGYDPDQSSIDLANKYKAKNSDADRQINFISNLESIGEKKFDSASAILVYHEADEDIFKTASKYLKSGNYFTVIDYNLKNIGVGELENYFNTIGEKKEIEKMGWRDFFLLHTRIGLEDCKKNAAKFGFKTNIDQTKKLNNKYFLWVGQKI